jgi:hypothetical protein
MCVVSIAPADEPRHLIHDWTVAPAVHNDLRRNPASSGYRGLLDTLRAVAVTV